MPLILVRPLCVYTIQVDLTSISKFVCVRINVAVYEFLGLSLYMFHIIIFFFHYSFLFVILAMGKHAYTIFFLIKTYPVIYLALVVKRHGPI